MPRMTRDRTRRLLASAAGLSLLVGAATFAGCRMEPRVEQPARPLAQVDFYIEPSMNEVLVGETVTFVARDRNTVGLDTQLDWTTTGGELTTERNNRIARVRFDQAGVFTVTGRLFADDVVISDSIDITVRQLR